MEMAGLRIPGGPFRYEVLEHYLCFTWCVENSELIRVVHACVIGWAYQLADLVRNLGQKGFLANTQAWLGAKPSPRAPPPRWEASQWREILASFGSRLQISTGWDDLVLQQSSIQIER